MSRIARQLRGYGYLTTASVLAVMLGACSADGGAETPAAPRPTTQTAAACEPLPDLPQGRIAYQQTREDGTTAIFVMKPDGTDRQCVVDTAGPDSYPNWSPDGKWLAFIGGDTSVEQDLFVVRADGSRLQRLATTPALETSPVWSPDGMAIAYTSEAGVDGASSIHVMARDGSADSVVVDQTEESGHPELQDWAPGQDSLLFVTFANQTGLWTVRADGTGRRFLGGGPGDYGSGASYSPDGRNLVFQADLDGGCIYRSDATVRHVERLTQGCSEGFDLTWSPDGDWIAWGGGSHGPADAYVMTSDGQQVHSIADEADVAYLDWQPAVGS